MTHLVWSEVSSSIIPWAHWSARGRDSKPLGTLSLSLTLVHSHPSLSLVSHYKEQMMEMSVDDTDSEEGKIKEMRR